MDSSSSSHSPLTEFTQSAENSSENPSANSSPKNPQHSYLASPSLSPPPTSPPRPPRHPPTLLADARRSSPPRFERLTRERERRLDLPYYEDLFAIMIEARCVTYYVAWNNCMDEALRTGKDHHLICASASRLFRECVRLF